MHTGIPNWIPFSNTRVKSGLVKRITFRLLDFSMFFTHTLAWP